MLTSQNFGLLSSTYSSLSAAGQGASGLTVGMVQQVPNTPNFKMLVQNDNATLAANAAVTFKSGSASSYIVTPCTTTGTPCIGVNDNAGGTVAANYYFWISIRGFVSVLAANGVAVDDLLGPTATSGTLDARTTAQQANIVATAANSSGSAAATAAYIF